MSIDCIDSTQTADTARILDARRVVPVHYDGWAHVTEGRDELAATFTTAAIADRLYWTPRLSADRQDHPGPTQLTLPQ